MRLNFAKLKEKVIINREGEKVQYFNKEDVKYWGSNTSEVEGIELEKFIIFIDNINTFNIKNYKIKLYDKNKKRVCTIYTGDEKSKIFILNLIQDISELKEDIIENIIFDNEVKINNKNIMVNDFILFNIDDKLKKIL